ncbi:MAG: hypothetical protein ACI3Y5_02660, partial [Prevotella sp.]
RHSQRSIGVLFLERGVYRFCLDFHSLYFPLGGFHQLLPFGQRVRRTSLALLDFGIYPQGHPMGQREEMPSMASFGPEKNSKDSKMSTPD